MTPETGDFLVRTVGWAPTGLRIVLVVVAWVDPRDVQGAAAGRETAALLDWVRVAVPVLRSFARPRGESICEASVSSTFAEPTIIDFGRGLRTASMRGLRGTAWVVIAFGFGRPTTDAGRETGLPLFVLRFLVAVLDFEAAALGDTGVVGLVAAFSNASWPSDRFRDSCTLNMSSCIDERRRAGVPKLFDLLERPGLQGVEGDGNDVVVAVLGREAEAGEEVVIGDGRSLV